MKYFAYGSNMSLLRLQKRVPSAVRVGIYTLKEHQLRFHISGKDGSGKCDAFHTNNVDNEVVGALFEINESEKGALDRAEGLGLYYDEKFVNVQNESGKVFKALTYYAINTDSSLKPYSWYLNHIIVGARETKVPTQYLAVIESIKCIEDSDKNRDAEEREIYS